MTEMILERQFDPPLTRDGVFQMAREGVECFGLHRVGWHGSLLAGDGRRMACWFHGPDTESARTALRQVGADVAGLWPATVHPAPQAPAADADDVLVVVARSFDAPVTYESVQSLEEAGAWCLESHRVRFVQSFFALDRRRMLCVYRAPDAESVRTAQRQAKLPVETVWACRYVHPRRTELPVRAGSR